MSQISNQQQGPGQQHSVQAPQQVRYPFHPGFDQQHQYQRQQHAAGFYVVNNPNPQITVPPNSQITRSVHDGVNMVDIASPPAPQYINYDPAMMNQMMQMQYAPQYHQMQYPPQYQPQPVQHQPAPKPLQPRKKNILTFVDPNSQAAVDLPHKDAKAESSTAPSPLEPKQEVSKPHTPVNEPKDVQSDTATACSDFTRAVIQRAKPMLEQKNPAVATFSPDAASFTPASVNLVPEHVNEASPASKEQTPVEQSPVPEEKMAPSIVLEEPQPETSGIDEERAEYEAVSRMDRASLIHHYENKLGDFIAVPENLQEIGSKIYSRQLVQILRDVIRTFQTVPCPISEDMLKKIGIDRATMPSPANVSHNKSKYNQRGDNFNLPWQNNTSSNVRRPPYNARHSDNKGKNNKQQNNQRQPVVSRPSIVRQKLGNLTRSEGAWVPDVVKTKTGVQVDASSLDARIEKVRKDVRGLLNKITPSTYSDLSVEMINKAVWKDPETLPTVVELIFIKAVEEPTFVKIYSDLCSSLHKAEQNMEKEDFKRHFHGAIIRKCQSSFENTAHSQYQETAGKIEKQIEEEQSKEEKDDKKIADLNEQLDEMKAKEKRRMIGTIKFISHLFRIGLLNYKIIENCTVILIRNAEQSKSELMIEYAVEMIKHVGPHTASKKDDETKVDQYVTYLEKFKPTVSNRVKFMIIDLMDLRDKKWVRKGDGPKTKDEVKMDVLKEEEQNRQDRDTYEKNAADQNRKKVNVVDKNPRYQGRPSDKKDRLAAAVNASHTTGSNLKKDTSKLEQQPSRLGTVKKGWGNPQGATAPVPSPAPIGNKGGAPRIIQRQSQDARQNTSNDARKYPPHKETKQAQNGPPPKNDPRSASATPPLPNDPSSSRSQNNTPTYTPEDKFEKGTFKSGLTERLQSHLGGTSDEEIAKSLAEFNIQLNNPIIFLEQMCSYCCEHLKLSQEKERLAVAHLIVKCVNETIMGNAFAAAFKKYCKYLVENEIWEDVPHLKKTLPEMVAHIMTDRAKKFHNKVFVDGFKELHEALDNKMFATTIATFGKILKSRKEDDLGTILDMTIDEFAESDSSVKTWLPDPIDEDWLEKN